MIQVLKKAIFAIEEQQAQLNKFSPEYCVGEQLKEILKDNENFAEIVLQDLEQPGMGLKDCEKKIADFAKKNKAGNFGFCPPKEAERIICEFYGIALDGRGPAKQESGYKVVNLLDML